MTLKARLLVFFGFAVCLIAGGVIGYMMPRPAPKPEPVTNVAPPPPPAPAAPQPVVLSKDAAKAAATLADTKAADTARTQAISRLLQEKAPGLDETLLKILDEPAEHAGFKALALQSLGTVAKTVPADSENRSRMLAKLQSYLDFNDVTMRRLALQALCQLKHESGVQAAVKWLNDDSKDANKVRDVAIFCITRDRQ
jgi:phytoene dehydrogenase-like protein